MRSMSRSGLLLLGLALALVLPAAGLLTGCDCRSGQRVNERQQLRVGTFTATLRGAPVQVDCSTVTVFFHGTWDEEGSYELRFSDGRDSYRLACLGLDAADLEEGERVSGCEWYVERWPNDAEPRETFSLVGGRADLVVERFSGTVVEDDADDDESCAYRLRLDLAGARFGERGEVPALELDLTGLVVEASFDWSFEETTCSSPIPQ